MQKYCNVVNPKRDFSRKSELSFSKTMRFILGMGSQTLGKEIMEFYGFNPKMVSVSAVVQRRAKILPDAFQHLFHKFNEKFSQTNFFHGYMLYVIDSSDIPTIHDDYNTHYSVLRGIILCTLTLCTS